VTRAVFGWRPGRRLRLQPACFVTPAGSPPAARDEISAMMRLLEMTSGPVVSELSPLLDRIRAGDFGLLHIACHNTFGPADGSSILFDGQELLATAAIRQTLARTGPLVFINACRSAGMAAGYHHLDGWATKFLQAGAAAFIGSLWAVRDETARQPAGHHRTGYGRQA